MSTAVVLAGGESRRMQRDKLALRFNGETLLASAVRRFSQSFDEVWLSVADPKKYGDIKAPRVADIYKGCARWAGFTPHCHGRRRTAFSCGGRPSLRRPAAALRSWPSPATPTSVS